MNDKQLCSELGITPEQLADWLKLGLPHGGTKRRRTFDAQVVADWLVERGLYKRPAGVVTTLRDVAKYFDTTSRNVGYWKDQGMPWQPGHYDLDAIAEWREARFGKRVGGEPEDEKQDSRGFWEAKRAKIAAEREAIKLARERGEVIDVGVATRLIGQHIAQVKVQLEQLPDYALSLVTLTAAEKKKFRERLKTRIRDLCEQFGRSLEELAQTAAGEDVDEASDDE